MKKICYDEKGNVVDFLQDRNDEIILKLERALELLLSENKANNKSGYKKFGYRMALQIENVLRSYGLMSAEEFVELTYDDIEDYWNKFRSLIAYYNLYFEIVANKQLLMAFMGINNRQYSQLEKHVDDDIKNLMLSINDSFVGMGFVASESGTVDSKATKMRLGAKEVGHSVVSATDEMVANAVGVIKTPLELEKEFTLLLGKNNKLSK